MTKKSNWAASGFGRKVSPDLVDDEYLDVEIVTLLQGTNLFGDAIYSYVQLTGRQLKDMFAKMQAGDNFKPADFGTVLAAGRNDPPKEVRDEMAATYNMMEVPAPAVSTPAFVQPKFFGDE